MVESLPRMIDLIVIGGGAAGFFGALQVAERKAGMRIMILEKTSKLLTKVRISGGGRCNITHNEFSSARFARHYPRGEKFLKLLLKRYQATDVIDWFKSKGISIVAEQDGRMFPETSTSQSIIDCFLNEAQKNRITIELKKSVVKIEPQADLIMVHVQSGERLIARNVLIASGGNPHRSAYQWIEDAGHSITALVPSLFTFNDPSKRFTHLMGISVANGTVRIAGTKFLQHGAILITHWGLSGPAVIKLSAWAADYLHGVDYSFTALVSWVGDKNEEALRNELRDLKINKPKQKIYTNTQYQLPLRLWQMLCTESAINDQKTWSEIAQRNLNKLIENLIRCPFAIKGKTTFKEEFVTCGGVDLQEINPETMESRKIKNLFFAGEVLNLDGETGGFNFQAAWTTAWIAAQSISGQ